MSALSRTIRPSDKLSSAVIAPKSSSHPAVNYGNYRQKVYFTCHEDMDSIAEDWRSLEGRAFGSVYDSLDWCRAALAAAGDQTHAVRIIAGRDATGRIICLLPLALAERNGAQVLQWLGGPLANIGTGLHDREWLDGGVDWSALWPAVEASVGEFDVIHLTNLPDSWDGIPHPLRGLANLRSANDTYVMALRGTFEGLYAEKRSAESRRGARKRDGRLERAGQLSLEQPKTRAAFATLLDVLFDQRRQRLGEQGVSLRFEAAERQIYWHLWDAADDGGARLLPLALCLDGRMLAITLGCVFGDTYHALTRSTTTGPEQKHSPGDALLRRTIERCCALGLRSFDFGPGHGAYKTEWADESIPLREALHPRTVRGLAYAVAMGSRTMAKAWVKNSRWLWPQAKRMRRLLAGRTGRR
jgi:CelD/BcsL family acetyltransferase involved in cellulose biosynthesis